VRRPAFALAAFAAAWLGGLLAVDDVHLLLALLPLFALVLPLAAGRYPGEDALERLRSRRPRTRPRRAPLVVPVPAGRPLLRPGLLLVACDAVRGPPR
jgi:hypothetical protein